MTKLPAVAESVTLCFVYRISQLRLYRKIAYPLFFYVPFSLIILFSIGFGVKIVITRKKRSKLFGNLSYENI